MYVGFTKQRASTEVWHLNVTSPVVTMHIFYIYIYMRTLIYHVCANIKVRDNNNCECALFAKVTKIIARENFETYGI